MAQRIRMKGWLLASTVVTEQIRKLLEELVYLGNLIRSVTRWYFNREQVGSGELHQYKRCFGVCTSSCLPALCCLWMANVLCWPQNEQPLLRAEISEGTKLFCAARISAAAAFCRRFIRQLVCFVGVWPCFVCSRQADHACGLLNFA